MQTRIDHQKYVADIVLSKLELLDRYCIVAGGAPRDWYLGKEATDIDVYLYCPVATKTQQKVDLLNELGLNIQDKKHEDWRVSEAYKTNHHILQLYNSSIKGEKIQIIFIDQPTFSAVVDTFPISISKVWYKKGIIHTTDDFENSVKYKILWKTVDSYYEDNKYLLKIREKFSDYTYISKEEVVIYEKQAQLRESIRDFVKSSTVSDRKYLKEILKELLQEID